MPTRLHLSNLYQEKRKKNWRQADGLQGPRRGGIDNQVPFYLVRVIKVSILANIRPGHPTCNQSVLAQRRFLFIQASWGSIMMSETAPEGEEMI